jgi:hypothetical protein
MIRHRDRNLCISLEVGELRLGYGVDAGSHWTCFEKDGWLGFRNPVSGTYIGHDGGGKFWAKVSHHRNNEYFVAKKHPGCGYEILMLHDLQFRKMHVGENDCLVEAENGNTLWEFVPVAT